MKYSIIKNVLGRPGKNTFYCLHCKENTTTLSARTGDSGKWILITIHGDWTCTCGKAKVRRGSLNEMEIINFDADGLRRFYCNEEAGELAAMPWLNEKQIDTVVNLITQPSNLLDKAVMIPMKSSK